MSHPNGLPDLFIDRSLGRNQVPQILRAAGLRLVTLAEHYTMPADERIDDVTWINDATALGWLCLMKDSAIARNTAERQAIQSAGARCFCLTNRNLSAAQMAGRFLAGLGEMIAICERDPGPFVYGVNRGDITKVQLPD